MDFTSKLIMQGDDLSERGSKDQKLPMVNDNQLTDDENELGCFPTLNVKLRSIGFAICYIIGNLMQLYAILASIGFYPNFLFGNALLLFGTLFIVHLNTQKEDMNKHYRKIALIIYFGSIVALIFVKMILIFLFVILIFAVEQWLTIYLYQLFIRGYLWYIGSYITSVRKIFKSKFHHICLFDD